MKGWHKKETSDYNLSDIKSFDWRKCVVLNTEDTWTNESLLSKEPIQRETKTQIKIVVHMQNLWIKGADCTRPFYVKVLDIYWLWCTRVPETNGPWIPREDCTRKQAQNEVQKKLWNSYSQTRIFKLVKRR